MPGRNDVILKLVQMPTALLHVDDRDLDDMVPDASLLSAFRAQLPNIVEKPRDVAILAPTEMGTRAMLMVLARRVGARLRDENIHLRESGGDMQSGRKRLCYLPAAGLRAALNDVDARVSLGREAACFIQELDGYWEAEPPVAERAAPPDLMSLLEERRNARLVTVLSADPCLIPGDMVRELRARMLVIEPG